MASWPTAPDAQGNGATENDLRRIVGAQYMTQGILPNGGLDVSGRSDMSYLVESGAAFMWTSQSERLGVLVPVESVTVPTEAAPASGSRTDSIYILQDGIPRVTSGEVPATGVLLGQFIIGAGVTGTNAGQKTIDRDFAIATGASLGRIAHWTAPSQNVSIPLETDQPIYAEQFVVPTDRLVRVDMTITLTSTDGEEGMAGYTVSIGGFSRSLSCVYGPPGWRTYSGTWTTEVPGGVHTLSLRARNNSGAGWTLASGSSTSEMNLWDAGVAQ